MELSKRASFTTVPLEIRREIYSYLLLSFNTVVQKTVDTSSFFPLYQQSVVEAPQISTALFTTSKEISFETLDYFYRENAFVAVRTYFTLAMRKCSLLFPSFFWIVQDDTGTGISRTNQCIEQVGLVIDIHKFWSRLDRHRISKHISAETGVLVFNLRYLETVIRVLNATQFQRYRNKEMVIHLDYWFGQPDDERCTRIRETNINALKTLRSDYRSDGSSYLTLIITGSVGEQEVASIRAIDFIRHSTTELLEDCEWAIAIGDKERRNGNLKQAENYYNVSDHFTEIIDIFHEEYGALRFRLVVLHMERSLGIAACFYAAKDYENSSLEASRTSQVACLLMDGRSEEEVNVCTRILYRVGNILRKLGGPQRGHHLREARHTLCMALLYTTDLALEEDVKATMHFAQQDGPSAEDPLPDWIIDLDTDGKLKEAQMY